MAISEKRQSTIATWVGLIILFFAIRACFSGGCGSNMSSGPSTTATPKTRSERIKDCFSAWDGSHKNLEKWVKDNMNDPDSYEHIETRYQDNGATITIYLKFRGKNAFGGKVVNMAVATTDDNCNIIGTPNIVSQ